MLGVEESVFFKSGVPTRLTMLQWKAMHPIVCGQHKLAVFQMRTQSLVGRERWVYLGDRG